MPLSSHLVRLLLSCTMLLLSVPFTVSAKEKKLAAPPSVEFSLVIWGEMPFPELFYRREQEYLPIKLSPGQRSPVCLIQGAYSLELLQRSNNATGKGSASLFQDYELAGLAPLLNGANQMLILIEAAKEPDKAIYGLPLHLRVLDDSLKSFPAGSFRFLNLTPGLLRIELAGAIFEVPHGAQKVATPEIPESGAFLPLIIKNEDGQNLFENRLMAQRTGRELVVVTPSAEGRKELTVKFLSDSLPAVPKSVKKRPLKK